MGCRALNRSPAISTAHRFVIRLPMSVECNVFHEFEVGELVVVANPIDVMDFLAGFQLSAEVRLHHKAMFLNVPPAKNQHLDVAIAIQISAAPPMWIARARICP